MMILEDGPLFIADTHVHIFPTPEELAETAIGAARHVRRFGVEPNIAFCSHRNLAIRAAIPARGCEPHLISWIARRVIFAMRAK